MEVFNYRGKVDITTFATDFSSVINPFFSNNDIFSFIGYLQEKFGSMVS